MEIDDKHHAAVLDWYQSTSSRTVDLIGDYAGRELFLIELDSLLLSIFEDSLLDFSEGFQLLQAVHAVEHFLHQLRKRKCNFAIVAFHQHADLCIPPSSSPSNDYKYRLARIVIIRHLERNLKLDFNMFPGSHDPNFRKHMADCGALFLMVHDGAHAQGQVHAYGQEVQAVHRFKRARLRKSIMSCIAASHTVALINGIEFRDTKVLATILEANVRKNKQDMAVRGMNLSQSHSYSANKATFGDLITAPGVTSASTWLMLSTLRHLNQSQAQDSHLNLSMIVHNWLLRNIPLSSRSFQTISVKPHTEAFLKRYTETAESILNSDSWKKIVEQDNSCCDIADFIDGRIFHTIAGELPTVFEQLSAHSTTFVEEVQSLWPMIEAEDKVEELLYVALTNESSAKTIAAASSLPKVKDKNMTLLPFSNTIFDAHLECVKIEVGKDDSFTEDEGGIFKELTHWHNTNKLPQVASKKKPQTVAEQRAAERAMRRNQLRKRDMSNYAASLTNSSGRVLEPEGVFVQTDLNLEAAGKQGKPVNARAPGKSDKQHPVKKGNVKSEDASAIIARETEKRTEAANLKIFQGWESFLKRIEKADPQHRYLEVCKHFSGLTPSKAEFLRIEVSFYCLVQLMQLCAKSPFSAKSKPRNLHVAAMIWDHVNKLRALDLDGTDLKNLQMVCKTMNFPDVNGQLSSKAARKSAFQFLMPPSSEIKIMDAVHFQLSHCGPFLDRTIEAELDSRVRFKPDKWQRQVLDLIDQRKSAFVVAPTSAGKTFISFYAMKKVLQEDNEGILVYVAPTKALVNQISAEIQANFKKTYPHSGISVWALHTRDYRINEPTRCQILVTVPHVLQIMLLSPRNATKFSTRVKRIIFDEIHSIGQTDDGLVWEQLLLLAPCPIIALSATVGNPEQFSDWLKATQRSNGNELAMVKHSTRYNDLRKYVFIPPKNFEFKGLSSSIGLSPLGIDSLEHFHFIHPVISLVNKSRGIPEDLSLESRDCLQLWGVMKSASNEKYPLSGELDPSNFISKTIRKADVIAWERKLKDLLSNWMSKPDSPFDNVHKRLYDLFLRKVEDAAGNHSCTKGSRIPNNQSELIKTLLPLLAELNSNEALPALIFNYDRSACEKICINLVAQLEAAEEVFKKTSSSWKKKLAEHTEYVKKMERSAKASKKASAKASKNKGSIEDGATRADMLADSAQMMGDRGSIEYFRPEDPLDEFTFADKKKATPSEIDDCIKRLQWVSHPPELIKALSRGIGVHHAGMNIAYRQCVEILFRKGFLRVVVATGTLALGINMPCKTVVFAGDSVYLTALNFRQAAGRAGRRGFDLLGNVVFHGISIDKVLRLMSSRLPDLNGHFPVTTSLVLRLFNLLNDSNESPFAKAAVNSLLSQPRLYLGGDDFKEQVLHHLRFSIEYLRRQRLLDRKGAPINFAGCIMHLYYTENSSFAFHALLKDGFFHGLAATLRAKNEEHILPELMLVMAHLFGRRTLRQAESEDEYHEQLIHRSPSIVSLPRLPSEAENILLAHNNEVKQIFETYVRTFAEQHLDKKIENKLPLSQMAIGGAGLSTEKACKILGTKPPSKVRSAFTALSGHGDDFTSIHELCKTARDGVFLEEAIIPHVPVYTEGEPNRLNAYLLDFYKHGDLRALEEENGIRKGDIWFVLNEFSLVMATIVTSLKNYMNLTDSDMFEVRARGDGKDDDIDDLLCKKLFENQGSQNDVVEKVGASKQVKTRQKKKAPADSWEDDALEDEESDVPGVAEKFASMKADDDDEKMGEMSGMPKGAGLLKVLKMFERLKVTFDERFKVIWA